MFSWFVLVFFFVINCVASVVQGITTFGDAIVLHILWDVTARWTLSLDSCATPYSSSSSVGSGGGGSGLGEEAMVAPDNAPWWCAMHSTALGTSDMKLVVLAMYSRTVLLNTMMVWLALRTTHAEEKKKKRELQESELKRKQSGIQAAALRPSPMKRVENNSDKTMSLANHNPTTAQDDEEEESLFASPMRRAASFGLMVSVDSPRAETATTTMVSSGGVAPSPTAAAVSTPTNKSKRAQRIWQQWRALMEACGMSGSLLVASIFPQYVGSIVGETILTTIDQAVLRMYFGIFLLFFAAIFVALKLKRTVCPKTPTSQGGTAINSLSFLRSAAEGGGVSAAGLIGCTLASFSGGVAGALTGVGGPPWMIFILVQDVPSFVVRLLFPLSSLPATYSRFAMAVRDGLIHWEVLPYHAVALAGGVIGVLTGYACGKRVGPQAFNAVVLSLIVLAAMVVLTQNPTIQIVSLFAALGLVLFVQRREENEKNLQQQAEVNAVTTTATTVVTEQSTNGGDDFKLELRDGQQRRQQLQDEEVDRIEDRLEEIMV